MRNEEGFSGRRRPDGVFLSTNFIVVLVVIASAWGLIDPARMYTDEEFIQAFKPNDVVNLVIGVPILLGSIWAARRGSLRGLLFWPGALLFLVYNYLAYLLALPLSWGYVLHLLIVVMSLYTILGLAAAIDAEFVRDRLDGKVPARLAGGVLVGLGVLFFVRVLGLFGGALLEEELVSRTEVAVSAADVFLAPASVIVGLLLWQGKAFGYAAGLGLLFQESMLFIGLIFFLLLQPVMTGLPMAVTDITVVAAMGLVCFIPFGMFVRATAGSTDSKMLR